MLVMGAVLVGCRGSSDKSAPAAGVSTSSSLPETSPTEGGPPMITSVVWRGNEAEPSVAINGQGFGARPMPQPPGAPSQLASQDRRYNCNMTRGNEGLDYGTELSLQFNDDAFSAGRYRPQIGQLDCVGLLIAQYSDTMIVLRLGAAYTTGRDEFRYTIRNGDRYEVVVKAAVFRGIVQYG